MKGGGKQMKKENKKCVHSIGKTWKKGTDVKDEKSRIVMTCCNCT